MQRVKDTRAGDGDRLLAEEIASVARKIEQAQALGLDPNRSFLLQEAEKMLQEFRREGSQRKVAEHRLRLALNAKDLQEIQFSVKQVQDLDISHGNNSKKNKDDTAEQQGGVF